LGETSINLCILEDDQNVASNLEAFITKSGMFSNVFVCNSISEAWPILTSSKIDCFLCDLSLPDGSGHDAIKIYCKNNKDGLCIVFSHLSTKSDLMTALKNGARGYILKNVDSDKIVESIGVMMKGGSILAPEVASYLVSDVKNKGTFSEILSVRETQILQLLSKGLTRVEMARVLNLSEKTIPVHTRNIYKKLDVNNKIEAVLEGLNLGLIE